MSSPTHFNDPAYTDIHAFEVAVEVFRDFPDFELTHVAVTPPGAIWVFVKGKVMQSHWLFGWQDEEVFATALRNTLIKDEEGLNG